jgi:hypothetical protein
MQQPSNAASAVIRQRSERHHAQRQAPSRLSGQATDREQYICLAVPWRYRALPPALGASNITLSDRLSIGSAGFVIRVEPLYLNLGNLNGFGCLMLGGFALLACHLLRSLCCSLAVLYLNERPPLVLTVSFGILMERPPRGSSIVSRLSGNTYDMNQRPSSSWGFAWTSSISRLGYRGRWGLHDPGARSAASPKRGCSDGKSRPPRRQGVASTSAMGAA